MVDETHSENLKWCHHSSYFVWHIYISRLKMIKYYIRQGEGSRMPCFECLIDCLDQIYCKFIFSLFWFKFYNYNWHNKNIDEFIHGLYLRLKILTVSSVDGVYQSMFAGGSSGRIHPHLHLENSKLVQLQLRLEQTIQQKGSLIQAQSDKVKQFLFCQQCRDSTVSQHRQQCPELR